MVVELSMVDEATCSSSHPFVSDVACSTGDVQTLSQHVETHRIGNDSRAHFVQRVSSNGQVVSVPLLVCRVRLLSDPWLKPRELIGAAVNAEADGRSITSESLSAIMDGVACMAPPGTPA